MNIETIIQALLDIKGTHVVRYALRPHDLVDDVILVTAQNSVHLGAIVDTTDKTLGKNREASRLSGRPESGWMIFDGSSFSVHVLLDNVREMYELDRLFSERGGVAYHH